MVSDGQNGANVDAALDRVRVYELADLEQHLAAVEAECSRLRSSIAAAEARRDEALAARPQSVAEQLGNAILDAQARLTEEWRICHRNDAALEQATEELAAQIVAEALARSEAVRAATAKLSGQRDTAVPDDADQWSHDVIDLTRLRVAEPARTA